jgi:hypothetical protein
MRNRIVWVLGILAASVWELPAQEPTTSPSFAPSGQSTASAALEDVLAFHPTNHDVWLTADFLFGWMEGAHLPRLVTTSPVVPAVPAPDVAGVLPAADTLLHGTVNQDLATGLRLGGGYIFDQEKGMGVEAGFLFVSGQSSTFGFSSDDFPILAQPFIDADSGDPGSFLVAYPDPGQFAGAATGTIAVDSRQGSFYATNLGLMERAWETEGLRIDALFGYRFYTISDQLRIRTHRDLIATPAIVDSEDSFRAANYFHGLDFGFRTTYAWSDRVTLNLLTKVAAGNLHRNVNIRGKTTTTVNPDPPATTEGGLYALASNIGEHTTHEWGLLPEAGANFSWQVRSNVFIRAGYSLLYLTKIARADNQIDFTVNPDLIPGPGFDPAADPARPAFHIKQADMWIQTINLGVDVIF